MENILLHLQEELANSQKYFKLYQNVRWLSPWQTVTTLGNSLGSGPIYFRDNLDNMEYVSG